MQAGPGPGITQSPRRLLPARSRCAAVGVWPGTSHRARAMLQTAVCSVSIRRDRASSRHALLRHSPHHETVLKKQKRVRRRCAAWYRKSRVGVCGAARVTTANPFVHAHTWRSLMPSLAKSREFFLDGPVHSMEQFQSSATIP